VAKARSTRPSEGQRSSLDERCRGDRLIVDRAREQPAGAARLAGAGRAVGAAIATVCRMHEWRRCRHDLSLVPEPITSRRSVSFFSGDARR
jgi:hypothetical protein